jgi:hypothetical protein
VRGTAAATTTSHDLGESTDRDHCSTATTCTAMQVDDRSARAAAADSTSAIRLAATTDTSGVRLTGQHSNRRVDGCCCTTTTTVGRGKSARTARAADSGDVRTADAIGNRATGEGAWRGLADVCRVRSRIRLRRVRIRKQTDERKTDGDQRQRDERSPKTRTWARHCWTREFV